jgi:hypothetical protein
LRAQLRLEPLEVRTLPSFAFAGSFPTGLSPYSVVAGDFNGDGKPDLAVANRDSNSVSVLLGNGDGTFQAAVNYPVDTDPRQVAVADFNGDGRLDLVTCNGASNTVSVLLGCGNGKFKPALNFASGGYTNTMAVADINGDGKADLVTVAEGVNSPVNVLLGNGNGTFQAPQVIGTGNSLFGAAVADFNGDGRPDVVVGNATLNNPFVTVFLGNGNGTFQAPQTFATAPSPISIAVADFNHDGKLDLVTANNGSSNVSVLLGNGNGTFQPATNFAVPTTSYSVAVADLNGDGNPDVVVGHSGSSSNPDNTVSLLLGNGNGTFTPAQDFAVGKQPSVAIADLNHDGRPDIVTANFGDDTVGVLLNTWAPPGSATFTPETTVNLGASYSATPTIADVNGDGKPDLVVADYAENMVSVFLGNGNGTFQAPINTPTPGPGPRNPIVADVNGDGIPDLIVINYGANSISILQGNGNGTFQPASQTLSTPNDTSQIAVADLNGDGKPDLVVGNYTTYGISLFLGNGNGTFQAAQNIAVGNYVNKVTVADLNGDGKLDLVTANTHLTSNLSVLLGNGNGTFQAPQTISLSADPFVLSVADINGDGKPDLVVGTFSGTFPYYIGQVVVLLGNGNGTFANGPSFTLGTNEFLEAVADMTGDGQSDLVVETYRSAGNNVSVLLGNGDGTFAAPLNTPLSQQTYALAVADLNGDGRPDVIGVNYASVTLSVYLQNHNAATHFQVSAPATTVAGNYFPLTVTALTAGNQEDALYQGTVVLTSNDSKFVPPPPYTLTLFDGGAHTFFVDLQKAGSRTITATDTVTSSITGTATVSVQAAAATHYSVTGPSSAKIGVPFNITVTALDRFGNVATGYRGTVHFTSTDPAAVLPSDYTYTATDKGKHTFSVTLNTAGTQTITATDTVTSSITGKFKVTTSLVPFTPESGTVPAWDPFDPRWLDEFFAGDRHHPRGVLVGGRGFLD